MLADCLLFQKPTNAKPENVIRNTKDPLQINHKTLLTIFILILFSYWALCQVAGDTEIVGSYQRGVPGLGTQNLPLSKDILFSIEYHSEFNPLLFLEDYWTKKGKYIFMKFNSSTRNSKALYSINEEFKNNLNQIKLTYCHEPISGAEIYYSSNGNLSIGRSDIDGNFVLPPLLIDAFIINSIGLDQVEYKVMCRSNNYFEVNFEANRKYYYEYLNKDSLDQSDTLKIINYNLVWVSNLSDEGDTTNWNYLKKMISVEESKKRE